MGLPKLSAKSGVLVRADPWHGVASSMVTMLSAALLGSPVKGSTELKLHQRSPNWSGFDAHGHSSITSPGLRSASCSGVGSVTTTPERR